MPSRDVRVHLAFGHRLLLPEAGRSLGDRAENAAGPWLQPGIRPSIHTGVHPVFGHRLLIPEAGGGLGDRAEDVVVGQRGVIREQALARASFGQGLEDGAFFFAWFVRFHVEPLPPVRVPMTIHSICNACRSAVEFCAF